MEALLSKNLSQADLQRATEQDYWETTAEISRQCAWTFLKHFTYTLDEHDDSTIAKAFPMHGYLRIYERIFREILIFYAEKSRQMKITWTEGSLILHEAMMKKAKLIADQSKKQEDADAILERQRHVYRNILPYAALFDASGGFPYATEVGGRIGTADKLEFEKNKSKIIAIPQGAHILRSYTWSRIFGDEINHQPDCAEGYAAAMPAISGGGHWNGVGTPNGRTWAYYVREGKDFQTGKSLGKNKFDSNNVKIKPIEAPHHYSEEAARYYIDKQLLDIPQEEFDAIPLIDLVASCPGMRMWENNNGITCIRIHYTVDPAKDPKTEAGKAWYTTERQRYTKAFWEREYEIRYDTFEGRPVISNWDRQVFVKKPEYNSDYPLLLSFDFGTRVCGTPIAQYQKIENYNAYRLKFLEELILEDSNTHEMAAAIIDIIRTRYPRSWKNNNIKAFCDPAGHQTTETVSDKSLNTSIKILNSVGIYPRSKKFGVPESTEVLETIFTLVLPDGQPAIEFSELCEYLIGVCAGGLHYPENGRQGYYAKDGWWDHGGDMIRMMACNVFDYVALSPEKMPAKVKKFIPIRNKYTADVKGYKLSKRFRRKAMSFGR